MARTLALTRTGVLLGTPLYMAPEQFLRRPTDARTDQFSFCVSLHEALYGERPFPCTRTTLRCVAGQVSSSRSKARPLSFLRKLLLRGLSAEPGARFPSMKALLEALRYDPVRRRRNLAIGATAAAIAVAALVGGQRLATRGLRMCRGGRDKLAGIWELDAGGGQRAPSTMRSSAQGEGTRRTPGTASPRCSTTTMPVEGDVHRLLLGDPRPRRPVGRGLDLRMAFLEGPRGAFKALTEALSTADPTVLFEAVNAAHALPPLDRCSDVPLYRRPWPPRCSATRARVAALRKDLAEVKALTDTGRWPAARHESGRSSTLPMRLATNRSSSRRWQPVPDSDRSQARRRRKRPRSTRRSTWSALATHRDDIALESASVLVGIYGYYLGRAEDAERWAEVGEALLRRVGPGHERAASWFYQDRAVAGSEGVTIARPCQTWTSLSRSREGFSRRITLTSPTRCTRSRTCVTSSADHRPLSAQRTWRSRFTGAPTAPTAPSWRIPRYPWRDLGLPRSVRRSRARPSSGRRSLDCLGRRRSSLDRLPFDRARKDPDQ